MLLFQYHATTAAHRITRLTSALLPVMRLKSRRLERPAISSSKRVVFVVAVVVVVAAAAGGVRAVIALILGINGVLIVAPTTLEAIKFPVLMGSRSKMGHG